MSRRSRAKPPSPFRYFHSAPEVIREVVMLYVRFPLSLRLERHIVDRQTFKARRSAALAEWKSLVS